MYSQKAASEGSFSRCPPCRRPPPTNEEILPSYFKRCYRPIHAPSPPHMEVSSSPLRSLHLLAFFFHQSFLFPREAPRISFPRSFPGSSLFLLIRLMCLLAPSFSSRDLSAFFFRRSLPVFSLLCLLPPPTHRAWVSGF